VEPRSSSTIWWPWLDKSEHIARLPTAPIAIFRKKLESGFKASLGIRVQVVDYITLGEAAAMNDDLGIAVTPASSE
jgi:hypothetical protein